MIQFNLLPDVKQQYIKAVYRRRLITLVCFVIGGLFLLVFILMFLYVRVNQTRHLTNLDSDIKKGVTELQQNKDLDKILTIQNQLNSLPGLHEKKIMTSRIFDYLTQITPAEASISNADLDVENKKITIKGSANSLQTVNKFVDTIKFTDYRLEGESAQQGKAFSSVVLLSFTIQPNTPGIESADAVSYQIEFLYEDAIFRNTAIDGSAVANTVTLTVPKIITTRSETQKPSELFRQSTVDQLEGETQ